MELKIMRTTSGRQRNRHVQTRFFARAAALVSALCALAFANFATADIYFNVASGDWNHASNWDAGVPTSTDTVYINSSRTATIDSGDSGEASVVRVGYGSSENGILNVDGTLTTGGNVTIGYSSNSTSRSKGSFTQGSNTSTTIGGTLTVGGWCSNTGTGGVYTLGSGASLTLDGATSDLLIGNKGYSLGSFTCNGTLDVARNLTIGYGDGSTALAAGSFTQGDSTAVTIGGDLTVGGWCSSSTSYTQGASSTVSIGGDLYVGNGYNDSASYTVPETGTLTLGAASNVYIAYDRNARGDFEFNSTTATLDINGSVTVGYSDASGSRSKGSFTQGAGTNVTIGGTLIVGGWCSNTGTGGVYTLGSGASLTLDGATSDLLIGNKGYSLGSFTCNGTLDVARNLTIGYGDGSTALAAGSFTQGDSTAVTIGGTMTIGDWCSSSTSYTQGASSTVSVGGDLYVGKGYNHTGDGASYTVPETGTLTLGATSNVYIAYGQNARGDFEFNSTTATLDINGDLTIGYSENSNYAAGSFTQGDSTKVTIGGTLTIGDYCSQVGNGGVLTLGDGASLSVTGATNMATASYSRGKFSLSGGTASLSTLSMGSAGTIEGYGTISGTTLTMNGTVRASGGTLDLSGFDSIVNASGSGWFVENGGAITLPTTAVAAGDGGDFTWGALATAVNSVDLDFTGVTGGDLSITVLDPDTDSYLPGFGTPSPTTGSIVSLWEIDGSAFDFGSGTVSLVFRYDDSRLGGLGILDETQLKVYHYTGLEWELLETAINPTANTASVSGVTSFSPFAVGINISGAIPEPASLALLTLGTAWLLNRQRGRRHDN